MKRIFDIIIAVLCLVLFSPLILVCWLAIKLGGGPAIYKQERIGKGGRPFYIYKFRSMVIDAEKEGDELLQMENDPRLTKIGHFLRNHHLDELPQLWNVLRGDMSFVGYRPERKFYIDQIMQHDPRYERLYAIRPGVTSYATLYNGYTDTMYGNDETNISNGWSRFYWFPPLRTIGERRQRCDMSGQLLYRIERECMALDRTTEFRNRKT